jgi:hypothetical protein
MRLLRLRHTKRRDHRSDERLRARDERIAQPRGERRRGQLPRPPGTIGKLTTVVTLATFAALAAGCGGGSSAAHKGVPSATETASTTTTDPSQNPANALRTVQQALAVTRAANSAHVTSHFVYDTDSLGTNTDGVGTTDFANGNAQWVSNLAGGNQGVVPPNTPFNQLSMAVRQVGNDLYVSLPAAFSAAGITEPWVSLPANAPPGGTPAAEVSPMNARIALAARVERPAVAFDLLGTVKNARYVGPVSVNGTATTDYSIDVNPRVMLSDIGLMSLFGNPTNDGTLAAIDDLLAPASTVDVDIDAAGRVRALMVDLDLAALAPSFVPTQNPAQWRELRTEWDFDTFGVPATVTAPPQPVHPLP